VYTLLIFDIIFISLINLKKGEKMDSIELSRIERKIDDLDRKIQDLNNIVRAIYNKVINLK
jgi:hypothetical protein